jgi:hypothetical protein
MNASGIIDYYTYYLKNIYTLSQYYEMKFISASKLIIPDTEWVFNSWKSIPDPILNESNVINIAESIIKNGTYWICVVDSRNNVLEGRHRVTALQSTEDTCNYPLLCIIIDDWDNRFNIKLDEPRPYFNPISFIMDYTPAESLPNMSELELTDNPKIAKLYSNDYGQWLGEIILYANRLNRYIYLHTKYSKQQFVGSLYLNDPKIFSLLSYNIRHKYNGKFQ